VAMPDPNPAGPPPDRRRNLAQWGWLLILCLCSCPLDTGRPNLLVISIDSLRWDHVGAYGYERATTPRLDAFASEGILFEQAIAQAPWTTPSMISVMTSLYPSAHGVERIQNKMSPTLQTLAQILRTEGYRTGAIVPFVTLWSYYGLQRGFDDYREDYFDHDSLSSHVLGERTRGWLRRHGDSRFFFWVHFWDPHYNYRPSREVQGRFTPADHPFGDRVFDIQELKWRENPLRPDEVAYNIDRYDEEILFTDRHIGRLLDDLEETGLAGNTLVVIVSDHGEQFQEHGWLEHTNRVYDNLIRVPLLLRLPGRLPAGVRIAEQVELIDLLPTVLDLLGIDVDAAEFQGHTLEPLISGSPSPSEARPAFSETARLANLKTIRFKDWKYIHDFDSNHGELYRIDLDPEERNDLAPRHPDRADRMRIRLIDWLQNIAIADPAGAGELDSSMREKLCSMGYIQCDD
jgi:arylsulfatase A-like enzyme